ncbi:hypothetical protein SAMN05428947_104369 [Mucilaginibacter sp. OK283]|nr:hypothetical protein SAMN05428947_104369 [Mucilaginibacter sp. OK283]
MVFLFLKILKAPVNEYLQGLYLYISISWKKESI